MAIYIDLKIKFIICCNSWGILPKKFRTISNEFTLKLLEVLQTGISPVNHTCFPVISFFSAGLALKV